jgi:hypothetical protein
MVQNMDEPHRNLLNIWVFDKGGDLLGFGMKGRKMVRTIANHLYKLHKASYFCGKLTNQVFIVPYDICITFPYDAKCANGN